MRASRKDDGPQRSSGGMATNRDNKRIRRLLICLGLALEDRPCTLFTLPKRSTHASKQYFNCAILVLAVGDETCRPFFRGAQSSYSICSWFENRRGFVVSCRRSSNRVVQVVNISAAISWTFRSNRPA